MDLRLFSIENVPKSLPVWEQILDDLGRPPAPRIARTLGVGVSTVYRWGQDGAPKVACLALFWLTRWGRSSVDARATNDAIAAAGLARCLAEEQTHLRSQVAELGDECDRLTSIVHRLSEARHGSVAIANPTRMGTEPEGSLALEWPRVVGTEETRQALHWPALPAATEGRGNPEAQPQEAHSTTRRGQKRSARPLPSDPVEVASSSPLAAIRCQSDAIVPPPVDPLCELLVLRQARSLRSPAGGDPEPDTRRPPARAVALRLPPTHAEADAPAPCLDGRATPTEPACRPPRDVADPLAAAEAPAAPGLLSGASAPAPAWNAFTTLAATLQALPQPRSTR